MKAIWLERTGPPNVLREKETPNPAPGPGEVRIRVEATGVNFADLLQRMGLYGNAPPRPYILGFEVSGIVLECGPGNIRFQPGDRVVGMTRCGSYAEEVCIHSQAVKPIPGNLTFQEAAAIPVNYLTAWFCMFEMGRLQAGERVLIQGGTGGVGIALVQLAQWKGAEIFATAGSKEKIEYLNELGVKHAVNYRERDFYEEAIRIFGKRSFDLVIDSVGGKTLKKGYRLLAPLGRAVSYGLSSAVAGPRRNWIRALRAVWETPSFKPLDMIQRNVGVFGFHLGLLESKQEVVAAAFGEIFKLFEQGILRTVIAREFPLSAQGAAAAHTYLHERRNIGKVLLVPAN